MQICRCAVRPMSVLYLCTVYFYLCSVYFYLCTFYFCLCSVYFCLCSVYLFRVTAHPQRQGLLCSVPSGGASGVHCAPDVVTAHVQGRAVLTHVAHVHCTGRGCVTHVQMRAVLHIYRGGLCYTWVTCRTLLLWNKHCISIVMVCRVAQWCALH